MCEFIRSFNQWWTFQIWESVRTTFFNSFVRACGRKKSLVEYKYAWKGTPHISAPQIIAVFVLLWLAWLTMRDWMRYYVACSLCNKAVYQRQFTRGKRMSESQGPEESRRLQRRRESRKFSEAFELSLVRDWRTFIMASSAYHIASLLDKVRHFMVSLCSGDSGQLFTKLLPLFCSRLTFEWTTISLPLVWISDKECFFLGKCII